MPTKYQSKKLSMVCLNVWGARAGEKKVLDFFKKNKKVDVFCLQEMWANTKTLQKTGAGQMDIGNVSLGLFKNLSKALDTHTGFFRPHFYDFYGLAIFIKMGIKIIEEGEVYVHKFPGYVLIKENFKSRFKKSIFHSRSLQYATIKIKGQKITFVNFHGLWDGQKKDTRDKLTQTRNIIRFLKKLSNPYVLCGDLNLPPDSKSLKRLEETGLVNLVRKATIKSTRNDLYTGSNKLADYIFTSKGIEVENFSVLHEKVSDHNPLYLELKR